MMCARSRRCGLATRVLLTGVLAASVLIVVASPAAAASGWTSAGSMATARAGHTATLLSNGSVLVAGGSNSATGPLASAELYHPSSNSWSSAASMPTFRGGATATLLPNGKVLVAGGGSGPTGDLSSTAVLYDPSSNSWSSAGSMSTVRERQTATLLSGGKVLVAGGYDGNGAAGYLASADLYDPSSNSWSSAGSMAASRANLAATLLPNGRVLVAGGEGGSGFLASAELYDPSSNSWSAAATMANARYWPAATLLSNGEVLVAGGFNFANGDLASAELYDPSSNSWSSAASMATSRQGPWATLLADGEVLVVGGYHAGELASAELYDAPSNSWSSAGSMDGPRAGATVTRLANGDVLVAGGQRGQDSLASAQLYTPNANPVRVATLAASVSATAATLRGWVNPEGSAVTECEFVWGPTSGYGHTVPCIPDPGSGTTTVKVSAPITGLVAGSTYHYRLIAANSAGPVHGADWVFTTPTSGVFTFGNASVGVYSDQFLANYNRANAYTLLQSGTVTSMSIYLQPTGTTGTQVLEGVVYSNQSGAPHALLAATKPRTFHSTDTAGWYHLVFRAAMHLPPGRYWIGVLTGATTHVAGWRTDLVANSRVIGWNPFTSGPISPFPPYHTDDEQMSLYATYKPDTMTADTRSHRTRAAYSRPLTKPLARDRSRLG